MEWNDSEGKCLRNQFDSQMILSSVYYHENIGKTTTIVNCKFVAITAVKSPDSRKSCGNNSIIIQISTFKENIFLCFVSFKEP